MQATDWIFGIATLTMAFVAWQAWRTGNERRDVGLLAGMASLCGLGWLVVRLV